MLDSSFVARGLGVSTPELEGSTLGGCCVLAGRTRDETVVRCAPVAVAYERIEAAVRRP
jgi:hypothetical protein